jgi:short-subunit dehydrogenase
MPRGASIVNIASIGGEISVPHLLPYSASKFALVGLSEGLHHELASAGISVTTVCPGLMRTGSPRNASFKGRTQAEYAWFSIGSSLPGGTISSEEAARLIVEACRTRQPFLRVSWLPKVVVPLRNLLPGLTSSVLGIVQQLLPTAEGGTKVNHPGHECFSAVSPSILTTLTEQAAVKNNEVR